MSDDVDLAVEKLGETVGNVFEARQESLDTFLTLRSLANVAIQSEVQRLEKKFGAGDPRTIAMRSRLDLNLTALRALEVQRELATVQPAPPGSSDDVVIQGIVVDVNGRAVNGVRVEMLDEKGSPLTEVDAARVESGGSFTIDISPDAAKKIAHGNPHGVRLGVIDARGSVLATSSEAIDLTAKPIPTQRIVISKPTVSRTEAPEAPGPVEKPVKATSQKHAATGRTNPGAAAAKPARTKKPKQSIEE
jgi:hypothetical protein